jgi:hypothetical protein
MRWRLMRRNPERSSERREAPEPLAAEPSVDAAAAGLLLDELLPADMHYAAIDAETGS